MDRRGWIDTYLKAYSCGQLETVKDILSENFVADYSNLGRFEGRDAALKGLAFKRSYDDQTVTVLGRMSYQEGDKTVVALIGQHMNLTADIPVIHPVVYGGKYVFILNADGRIEKVSFVLEYQGENTFYLSHWKLAKKVRDYTILSDFDPGKALEHIRAQDDEKLRVRDTMRLLWWSMDTHNFSLLGELIRPEAVLSREKTYANGTMEGTGTDVAGWLETVESYYALSQHGYQINEIKKTADGWQVTAQLLSPHRLNTKKMHNANKYHSFFEEECTAKLDSELKITELKSIKMAEIKYNGFDILEVD